MRRRAFGLRPVPSLPSRPSGFNSSRLRLRRCAQALASRGSARGPSPPRWTKRRSCAVACCGRLRESVPSPTLTVLVHRVAKDGSRTQRPASIWSFHTTPRLRPTAACGKGVLACRRSVVPARIRAQAGATVARGRRVGHISFRSGSAQGVLVSL